MSGLDHGTRGPARAGPFGLSSSGLRRIAAACLLAFAASACATAPGPGRAPSGGEPEADGGPAPAPTEGRAALEEIRGTLDAGRPGAAAVLADSLYFRLRARPGLEELAAEALRRQAGALEAAGRTREAEARLDELLRVFPARGDRVARRLAELRLRLGDDPGAARVLRDHPRAVDDSARVLLRRAGRSMSVKELEGVLGGEGAEPAGEAGRILLAELAVARARAGRPAPAREAARRVLEANPRDPERERARQVLEEGVAAAEGGVSVGLLLPRTGRFASVGDRLREGIDLALERHGPGGGGIRLLEADTGADGADPAQLAADLREEGVVALLGPVRSGALARIAGSGAPPGPPVLSPTATRAPDLVPHLFTLWERERRELDAAGALGRWMGEVLRAGPVGAVYPAGALGRRAFLSFRRGLAGTPAWMAAASPYGAEATTLEDPISSVSAFGPRAVFAPGGSTASVLQMAPQLSYYGIRAALVAGGPEWSDPSTLRRLDPSFSQFRVVGTFVDRDDPESAWSRFRTAYEKTYRKSLFGNILPALGHDAMLLVLQAREGVHPPRPRALARRIGELDGVEGATGELRPDPATGTVHRRVIVRALEERSLVPVDGSRVRDWLTGAARLETARARTRRSRALKAVRESGIELEAAERGEGDGG